MKQFNIILIFILVIGFSSCSSSKTVSQNNEPNYLTEEEIPISECEQMSLEIIDGKLRAYGTATDMDRDFARQLSIASARGQMASDIKSLVTNVIDIYRAKVGVQSNNASEKQTSQHIQTVAENLVSYSTVLKSAIYRVSDGSYRYEVCIGMVDGAEKVAEDAISKDEQLRVAFNRDKFIQSYQEGLTRFRAMK
ncbi:MAG: hypothetical protein R3Y61_02105 [Rikenellaceae bacterium]